MHCAVKYNLPEKEIAISLIILHYHTVLLLMFITMLFTATYNDGKNTQIVLSLSRVNSFFLSDAKEGKTSMMTFSDSSKLFYDHKCVFVCKQLWATYIDVIELLHCP